MLDPNCLRSVPYAMVDIDTGDRICPACDARIPERYDGEGEQTTTAYARHYVEAHVDADSRRDALEYEKQIALEEHTVWGRCAGRLQAHEEEAKESALARYTRACDALRRLSTKEAK